MKEENLNNKKQEWVIPLIKEMTINDTEGKSITSSQESINPMYSYGHS